MKQSLKSVRDGIALMLDPLKFKRARLKKSTTASLEEKIAFDVHERPHFAYGVHRAAKQSKALGYPGITVIEFGCAGGNGLIALENIAAEVADALGVKIDIFGFDIGEGLPKPLDYRDLPFVWKSEQFKMDIPALESRLSTANLVIGDVAETVSPFIKRKDILPVGFVSFDLDYYTSTISAFKLFEEVNDNLLPRVYCYFDDTIGPDHELHCEFVGELLAIEEFNLASNVKKIAKIHGLKHKRYIPASWNDAMYVMHAFEHPLYNQYIDTGIDMQLALEN